MLPVVETGAPHLTRVEREAERLDEVQRGAGGQARPAGVTGVPVDLRMHEDYVDLRFAHHASGAPRYGEQVGAHTEKRRLRLERIERAE